LRFFSKPEVYDKLEQVNSEKMKVTSNMMEID